MSVVKPYTVFGVLDDPDGQGPVPSWSQVFAVSPSAAAFAADAEVKEDHGESVDLICAQVVAGHVDVIPV